MTGQIRSDIDMQPPAEPHAPVVCAFCMTPNLERTEFCSNCGGPIGTFCRVDPIKYIHTMGWGLRRMTLGRPRGWQYAAFWLMFGPEAVGYTVGICVAVAHASFQLTWQDVTPVVGALLVAALNVGLLLRASIAYFRSSKSAAGTCASCGYCIMHLSTPRCPECGTPFDPEAIHEWIAESEDEGHTGWDAEEVEEARFPVHCEMCAQDLTSLGASGFCPSCAEPFDRHHRLLHEYGPEAFAGQEFSTPAPDESAATRDAVHATCALAGAMAAVAYLVNQPYTSGPELRVVCVCILLVLTARVVCLWKK